MGQRWRGIERRGRAGWRGEWQKKVRKSGRRRKGRVAEEDKEEWQKKIRNCAAYIGIGGMRIENEPRH